MSVVHSYLRMSTTEQLRGDSLRRQVERGRAWIARNGHTESALQLHDIGRSAFHGRNIHGGRLGAFLAEIGHRVLPGHILMVENLDRLSRQGVDEAGELFKSILRAGVSIAVLTPVEHLYSWDEVANDFFALLTPLMAFHLAYLESQKKSDRLRAVWDEKRRKAAAGDDSKLDGRRPSWIDLDSDGGFVLNSAAADAIKFIFDQTIAGRGQRAILSELVKSFAPIGPSGKWNLSFVGKVLRDRSCMGERQPRTGQGRVAIGDALADYYPAAVDEATFLRAAEARKANRRRRGPNGSFVNLFTGLVFNSHDGEAMQLQTVKTAGGKSQRRLVSYGAVRKLPHADRVSVPLAELELAVLTRLEELRPDELEAPDSDNQLRAVEAELVAVAGRLGELRAVLETPGAGAVSSLVTAIAGLQLREKELVGRADELRSASRTQLPLAGAKDMIEHLRANPDRETRLRLRGYMSELVSAIWLKPEKHNGRVWVAGQVCYRNGMFRTFQFSPHSFGGSRVQVAAPNYGVDLRDQAACRRVQLWAKVAKLVNGGSVPPVVGPVPRKLGPAVAFWLADLRTKMIHSSWRVVRPKIERLVSFVGAAATRGDLTDKMLTLYKRHLDAEVREGNMAANSARVAWARAGQFRAWWGAK